MATIGTGNPGDVDAATERATDSLSPMLTEKVSPTLSAEASDLKALRTAVVDAAGVSGGLWLSYLFVLFYLAVAAGGVTHKGLFFEYPVKLPFLNVDLPLKSFFFLGPQLFLIVHLYIMLHFVLLADKIGAFSQQLREQIDDPAVRNELRRQLPSNVFVQFLAGPGDVRNGLMGTMLWLIALTTLVLGPAALLILFELQFLPYHSQWISWSQRLAVVLDLLLVWRFWPRIVGREIVATRRLRSGQSWRAGWEWLATSGVVFIVGFLAIPMVFAIGTFPGESLERMWSAIGPVPLRETLVDGRFSADGIGRVDNVKRVPLTLWPNRLVLPALDVPTEMNLDTVEKVNAVTQTILMRGRDLRGAVLTGARLRKGDFTGADLRETVLDGADLRDAMLSCALVPDAARSAQAKLVSESELDTLHCTNLGNASLNRARLEGARLESAYLPGASLIGASLQDVSLKKADLQGARMDRALLQGASLDEASLQKASLVGASLIRTSLNGADLQGASLDQAQLQGASFANARLQGASFFHSNLQGASFSEAQLQGASLDNSQLQGVSFYRAHLQGASLVGAQLHGASFEGAQLQGASLDGADLHGASLDRAQLQGASLEKICVWRVNPNGPKLNNTRVEAMTDACGWTPAAFKALRAELVKASSEGGLPGKAPDRFDSVLDPNTSIPEQNYSEKWKELSKQSSGILEAEQERATQWIETGCAREGAPHVVTSFSARLVRDLESGNVPQWRGGNHVPFPMNSPNRARVAVEFLKSTCEGAKGISQATRGFLDGIAKSASPKP